MYLRKIQSSEDDGADTYETGATQGRGLMSRTPSTRTSLEKDYLLTPVARQKSFLTSTTLATTPEDGESLFMPLSFSVYFLLVLLLLFY